jgi:hypothetical protein
MTVKQGMKDFPAETITAIETELEKLTDKYRVLRNMTREENDMVFKGLNDVADGKISATNFSIVYSKMFLKAKYDAQGAFTKISARLVAPTASARRRVLSARHSHPPSTRLPA